MMSINDFEIQQNKLYDNVHNVLLFTLECINNEVGAHISKNNDIYIF